jgi:putative ABC transport system ATP-binding protein
VLFLADGLIVDELHAPTADSVLDRMKVLDLAQHGAPTGQHAARMAGA